LLNIKMLILFF